VVELAKQIHPHQEAAAVVLAATDRQQRQAVTVVSACSRQSAAQPSGTVVVEEVPERAWVVRVLAAMVLHPATASAVLQTQAAVGVVQVVVAAVRVRLALLLFVTRDKAWFIHTRPIQVIVRGTACDH
jgi:hypothetical protein